MGRTAALWHLALAPRDRLRSPQDPQRTSQRSVHFRAAGPASFGSPEPALSAPGRAGAGPAAVASAAGPEAACGGARAGGGGMNGAGKRPAEGHPGQYVPRKRPAADEEDFVEEDFELEPPEDEDEEGADMVRRRCSGRRWGSLGDHSPCSPICGCASLRHGAPAYWAGQAPSNPQCHGSPPRCPPLPLRACWRRWTRGRWARRGATGRARPLRSSTPPPTSWVRGRAVSRGLSESGVAGGVLAGPPA